jgi:tetratricopeptide (TPR) repeat protein
VQRLAVLPAEVLISDPSHEWVRLALPLIVQEDLATASSVVPFFAKDGSGAYEGQATEVLRTVVEDRNGKLRLSATTTDPRTQKNQRVIDVEADSAEGILAVGNRLTKQIDAHAREFPTQSLAALKAFTFAAATQDPTRRFQLLSEAVAADNKFGLAYLALVEAAKEPEFPGVLGAGAAHHDQFAPLERTRWNMLAARYSHAPLEQQADAAGAVLKIAPNNVDALGTLGVDRFLQGRGGEGEKLLRRAITLNPANLNLPLQLANGFIESKRFNEAITLLRPLSGNASAIPALATAVLLEGNTKEASTIFQNLIGFLPVGNPSTNFLQSQWEAISTRNAQPVSSPAASLMTGYSSYLNGHFEEAAQFWRSIVQQTGDTDLRARAMLAASLNGAGRASEANKIMVMPFVPNFSDAGIAIAFNQMRQLLRL